MQFEDRDRGDGFVQVVRNSQCAADTFTVALRVENGWVYRFTDPETGDCFTRSGEELRGGLTVRIPMRSGTVWFYTREARG
jgi:hypothetical protein